MAHLQILLKIVVLLLCKVCNWWLNLSFYAIFLRICYCRDSCLCCVFFLPQNVGRVNFLTTIMWIGGSSVSSVSLVSEVSWVSWVSEVSWVSWGEWVELGELVRSSLWSKVTSLSDHSLVVFFQQWPWVSEATFRADPLFWEGQQQDTDFMGIAPHSGDIDRVLLDPCALRMCWTSVDILNLNCNCLNTTTSLLTYWTSVQHVKKNGHCDSLLTYPCPKGSDPCPLTCFYNPSPLD